MTNQHVIVVDSACRVSVDIGRVKFDSRNGTPIFVAPSDIAAVSLDHPGIGLTSAALRCLAESGAVVVISDSRHLPVGLVVPWRRKAASAHRLRSQFAFGGGPLRRETWRDVIRSKLIMQAHVLRKLGRGGALRIERLASTIDPDTVEHAESQGARHYFRRLFDGEFKRTKRGAEDPLNVRLNYGYAIARALVARAFAMTGLALEIGVGHQNSENPMNLADDFVEPFRPVVDYVVHGIVQAGDLTAEFKGAEKARVAGFVEATVRMGDEDWRIPAAIQRITDSFTRLVEGAEVTIPLPVGFSF